MGLLVSSHYRNTPDDLQTLSDAPAHHLYVLLPPQDTTKGDTLPPVLTVVQVGFLFIFFLLHFVFFLPHFFLVLWMWGKHRGRGCQGLTLTHWITMLHCPHLAQNIGIRLT